ncbi:MAG TPA: hemolysin III family protein, partial [Candidatus Saccharibacteria bacterium]|nr:hemolysin III family protein [Candidatus Saccharibacteria bacterium]
MKRTLSKSEVVEEIFNSVTHGLGAIAATVGLILGVVLLTTNISYKIGFIVYCSSLVLLMLMSCLYHALKFTKAKKVFKVI